MKNEKLVKVENLNVSFKEFSVLKNINCTFRRDAGVIGLIGANGAGKTPLIHAILEQEKIKSGKISRYSDAIAYCPDMPEFDSYITAEEVLKLSLKLKSLSCDDQEIEKNLKRVGLYNERDLFARNFSRGMKQRLGIAAAIILKPEILFLDEPTSALDPIGKEEILSLINDLSREMTVVISSHTLEDIQRIANSLLVIDKGKIIFEGLISDFIRNKDSHGIIALKSEKFKYQIKKQLIDADVPIIDADTIGKLFFIPDAFAQVLSVLSKNSQGIKSVSIEEDSLEDVFNHVLKLNKEE